MSSTDKRAQWQRHINAWRRSELSQKAYCESQGISLATFGYWRKRLSGRADNTPSQKFLAIGSAPVPSMVRVHLPGGIVLDVPTGSLAAVLPVVCQAVQVGSDA